MTPVKSLSGGERNRIILAKLFTRAANLLVLDEPTNDLDMETLEVLEARLAEYSGTLIVVSHDRQFLDNVVTSTIVFEDGGELREYVGGYSDWLRQGNALAEADKHEVNKVINPHGAAIDSSKPAKKLSYREQRELDALPKKIEDLESSLAALEIQVSASDFYTQGHEVTKPVLDAFNETQASLDTALLRWSTLEDRVRKYQESRKQ
jgi:ATP-binding cassette subfamily F protein uup